MTTSFKPRRGAPSPDIKSVLFRSSRTRVAQPRILLAQDNAQMCLLLAIYLEEAGYDVVTCHDDFEFVEHLDSYLLPNSTETYDLIISDIRMPHWNGLEGLEGLCGRDDFPPMIVITAFADPETDAKARKWGLQPSSTSPFSIQDLVVKVKKIVPIEGCTVIEVGADHPSRRAERAHPISRRSARNAKEYGIL